MTRTQDRPGVPEGPGDLREGDGVRLGKAQSVCGSGWSWGTRRPRFCPRLRGSAFKPWQHWFWNSELRQTAPGHPAQPGSCTGVDGKSEFLRLFLQVHGKLTK